MPSIFTSVLTAPGASVSGTVKRLAIPKTQQVDAGDLLLEIAPH